MKLSKESFFWVILFLVFMGLGYLHGYRPQNFEKSNFIPPTKVRILMTEDSLFPQELRASIEKEKNVQFEIIVSRQWQDWLANIIANPAADILILPSYWAQSLNHQGLLEAFGPNSAELLRRLSPDFTKSNPDGTLTFYPLYWMKTGLISKKENLSFANYLKDKSIDSLYLWADPDLILAHFRSWKSQGLWPLLKDKKILTMAWEDLNARTVDDDPMETSLNEETHSPVIGSQLSALLLWGFAVPKNAPNKSLSLSVIDAITRTATQESVLLKTPFSTSLSQVGEKSFPQARRATYIRDLNLTDTLIIDTKDVEAEKRLIEEFDFTL
ncbi:hypothetical protein D3C87_260300 [compost metagenome]